MRLFIAAICLILGSAHAATVAERLGLPSDAKLLIVHADDIGMSHSVNVASFEGLTKGSVNSGSLMVPCAWFDEAAARFREQPELDLGLHLTLTSEWKHYRWGSLSGHGPGYSLNNATGYQYSSVSDVVRHASPSDVKAELIAQVETALAHGIQPTHLDSHMGTLFATPEFFQAYVEVGRAYRLPILIPKARMMNEAPQLADMLKPGEALVDHLYMADPRIPIRDFDTFYAGLIENLQPGVTEIIIHLGFDDTELNAITVDHPDYGSAWRQADTDFFTRPSTTALLEKHEVHLVTWRELGAVLYPPE